MSNKKNPPTGSTRKQMSKEEKEWLKNFNQALDMKDFKALAKIMPKDKIVSDQEMRVRKEISESVNAKQRDIFYNQVPVQALWNQRDEDGHIQGHDEALDTVIHSKAETAIIDPTLNPVYPVREQNSRYSDYDYNPPSFPDEDALIAAIDHDRAQAEKQKVKSFDEFVNQSRRRKKYDPAS
jgi:hypothetical protein